MNFFRAGVKVKKEKKKGWNIVIHYVQLIGWSDGTVFTMFRSLTVTLKCSYHTEGSCFFLFIIHHYKCTLHNQLHIKLPLLQTIFFSQHCVVRKRFVEPTAQQRTKKQIVSRYEGWVLGCGWCKQSSLSYPTCLTSPGQLYNMGFIVITAF